MESYLARAGHGLWCRGGRERGGGERERLWCRGGREREREGGEREVREKGERGGRERERGRER